MANRSKSNYGTLYGIGVGPGDPELITVKALRILTECPVVILPAKSPEECRAYSIVEQIYPGIRDKEILCEPFPMMGERAEWESAHEQIYANMVGVLKKGRKAAFLTIGDVSLYSTFGYIESRAQADGFHTEAVAGVPSFCAAAARLGISLADADEPVHIFPGNADPAEALAQPGTKIFMKSGRKLAELKQAILASEKPCRAYAVTNCGLPGETVTENIADLDENAGYLTVVIVRSKGERIYAQK